VIWILSTHELQTMQEKPASMQVRSHDNPLFFQS
jgi:hypothetical protein